MVKRWFTEKMKNGEHRSLRLHGSMCRHDQSGRIRSQSPEERKNLLLAEAELEKNILTGEMKGYTSIETAAGIIIQKSGIDADGNSLSYRRLCREMRKAFLAYAQKELKHFEGEYDDYNDAQMILPSADSQPLEAVCQGSKILRNRGERSSETYLKNTKKRKYQGEIMLEKNNKCQLFCRNTRLINGGGCEYRVSDPIQERS